MPMLYREKVRRCVDCSGGRANVPQLGIRAAGHPRKHHGPKLVIHSLHHGCALARQVWWPPHQGRCRSGHGPSRARAITTVQPSGSFRRRWPGCYHWRPLAGIEAIYQILDAEQLSMLNMLVATRIKAGKLHKCGEENWANKITLRSWALSVVDLVGAHSWV